MIEFPEGIENHLKRAIILNYFFGIHPAAGPEQGGIENDHVNRKAETAGKIRRVNGPVIFCAGYRGS
jgi:hypothetical protein